MPHFIESFWNIKKDCPDFQTNVRCFKYTSWVTDRSCLTVEPSGLNPDWYWESKLLPIKDANNMISRVICD